MKYLTSEEAQRIIDSLNSPYNLAIEILWHTGIRVGELTQLKIGNINFKGRLIRVKCLKRKKLTWREIPLADDMLDRLKNHIKGKKADARLFPWSTVWVWKIMQRACKALDIDIAKAHPHALRHGFAMHGIKDLNVPLSVVQKVLGHTSLKTTGIYLDHFTTEDIRASYEKGRVHLETNILKESE